MTPTKSCNSLVALFCVVLLTLAFALSSSIKAQDNPNSYKLNEAGIQFTVPSDWDVQKGPDGTTIVAKKENDAVVVFSLIVLPRPPNVSLTLETNFAAFSQGALDSLKKDWKDFKADDPGKDSQNGMNLMVQSFKGSLPDSGDMEGLVIVFDSPKPIGILAIRTKKHSDALEKESTSWLKSIRKIE
jgi:hypothetical protein